MNVSPIGVFLLPFFLFLSVEQLWKKMDCLLFSLLIIKSINDDMKDSKKPAMSQSESFLPPLKNPWKANWKVPYILKSEHP